MPQPAHRQRLLRAMTDAGYSSTRSRRAIVDAITSAPGGLTAAAILERAQNAHPSLGLVTVYRTLDILSGLGLVRRIHMEGGCHTYALAQCAHGHHIICERCHRAVEFEGCELHALENSVTLQTGFRITDHWLEMFGLCPSCQQEADEVPAQSDCLAAD
ncbi:MAG TPA: transcriptional repressor [Chloroflexi bacterium]|jgi:Fe2+ or Zn2+ uptake regulation protein|nr:transcriptional repressor [Chloroflexota bacterium]